MRQHCPTPPLRSREVELGYEIWKSNRASHSCQACGSQSHDSPANPASIWTPTRMSLNPQGKDLRSLLGDPDARQQPLPRPRGSHGPPSEETRKVRIFSFPQADNSASKPRWFRVSATCTGQRSGSKWFPSISRVLRGTADPPLSPRASQSLDH
ncbi:hypothetical protein BDV39DRAFT_168786 [Aspergillus sergii]|uniref:Uncharacterized protein n=1 Tax=Aspergillus sergii TaxID=1034303 RepID=A0A5N6XFF8_9EURO|nr:hypothetical protein BDV39DRAFT_168786 [Aspergillus sergii]